MSYQLSTKSQKLNPAQRLCIGAVRLWQKTLSADHGGLLSLYHPYGMCRFTPSCSQYTIDAIRELGAVRGVYLGSKRILRCHPWSRGGHDPVTSENKADSGSAHH